MKLCVLLILLSITTISITGQITQTEQSAAQANDLTNKSGGYFKAGLNALENGMRQQAGDNFDKSLEVFLYSTINVQKNQKLSDCYNQLIETIYRIEIPLSRRPPNIESLSTTCGWNIDSKVADNITKSLNIQPQSEEEIKVELAFEQANRALDETIKGYKEIYALLTTDIFPAKILLNPKSPEYQNILKVKVYSDVRYKEALEKLKKAQELYINASNGLFSIVTEIKGNSSVGFYSQVFEPTSFDELSKLQLTQRERKVSSNLTTSNRNSTQTRSNLVRVVKAQNGDTIAILAQRYKASTVDVAKLNGLLPTTKLVAGREIRIPSQSSNSQIKQASQNVNNSSVTQKNLGVKPVQASEGKVQAVIDYMNENLNDPYSVRFVRWSKVIEKTYRGTSYWSVQVKFREKNKFGAYVLAEWIFYIKANKVVAVEKL